MKLLNLLRVYLAKDYAEANRLIASYEDRTLLLLLGVCFFLGERLKVEAHARGLNTNDIWKL